MTNARLRTKVFFEIEDIQINSRNIIDAVKTAWLSSGKRPVEMTDLTVYVKAEDKKAYFLGNEGTVSGYVALSNANNLSSSVYFDR